MSRQTAQRPASWLAQEQTTFVGRIAELARLGSTLKTSRLVTVTGTGGVGKTRLALRAARAAETRYPDGVQLVELSGLRDPELLPHTVAAALDLPEQDPRPRLEQVLDHLRDAELLLVLDTCEHLVEACALFAEAVLARTERVTVLATSREPLFVAGEHEYPLAPLTVPGPRTDPAPMAALRPADPAGPGAEGTAEGTESPGGSDRSDGGSDGDAVELFAQRASAVSPGFETAVASRADMARLCRHLDGIPLAIELAAAQLREASLEELTLRMDRRFLDLPGRPRGAAGRHQTLRDAIGWSYELCTPEERILWERLSVFAGPASAEAVKQVCAGPGLDSDAVTRTLIGLVDKSVITRTGGDPSRYRMLDTIREYGAERLAASGTQSHVRARHLRRYLALADELTASPLRQQVSKYQALRAEHDDIRAALEYAAALPGPADPGHPAIRLPSNLEWYWLISARFHEGNYWLTRGLERITGPGPDRAGALATRGYLTAYRGDLESGLADAREAVAIAEEIGDRPAKAHGLVYLAYILTAASSYEEAKKTSRQAEALLALGGCQEGLPPVLGTVSAYMELLTGDPDACLGVCERTLRMLPPDGSERWASGYLFALTGLAMSLLGKPDEGNRPVLHGLAMKQELGDMVGLAHCLGAAGLVAGAQQRHERTAWLIGATEPLWKKIGLAFIGVDVMQTLTEQAAAEARAALGDSQYAVVTRDAASRQLDQVIDLAVRDADRLPALPPASR